MVGMRESLNEVVANRLAMTSVISKASLLMGTCIYLLCCVFFLRVYEELGSPCRLLETANEMIGAMLMSNHLWPAAFFVRG